MKHVMTTRLIGLHLTYRWIFFMIKTLNTHIK